MGRRTMADTDNLQRALNDIKSTEHQTRHRH